MNGGGRGKRTPREVADTRRAPRRRPPSGRLRWFVLAGIGGAAIIALVALAVVYYQHGPAPSPPQSDVSPAVAEGRTIDGIRCETMEQALLHIHAHLAIFASGQPRHVSYGIGITDANVQQTAQGPYVAQGSCFYWLHTHTGDGVIHVESPEQRTFTLGEFFDLWGQPLSTSQVGEDTGPVIAYVNGQRYQGDPRAISLRAHSVIQLDVGTDVPPTPYAFAPNL